MKKLSFLFILLLWQFSSYGQGVSEAPRAATLSSGTQTSASLFTGQPIVNIPVYTVSYNQINVPIALSYNAGGVKPNEHPGWVGLNWNLQSGGFITRKVNDLPDDYDADYQNNTTVDEVPKPDGVQFGYYWKRSIINGNPNGNINFQDNEKFDTEPDEFYFNVNGISGKFFMNENGSWSIQGNKTFKVEFNGGFINAPMWHPNLVSGSGKTFSGFTITTDDGVKYKFGGDASSIQYSIPMYFNRGAAFTADTWYLKEIQTPEGKTVSFTYSENSANPFTIAMNLSIEYVKEPNLVDEKKWFDNKGFYQGLIIRPVYLRQIESPTELVVFEASTSTELRYPPHIFPSNPADLQKRQPVATFGSNYGITYTVSESGDYLIDQNKFQWQKLDKVWVFSKANVPASSGEYTTKATREYRLAYNNNSSERLMLQSVSQAKGLEEIKTSFNYADNPDITLPGYCDEDGKIDHWGYFNDEAFNLRSNINTILNGAQSESQKRIDLDNLFNGYYTKRNITNDITKAIEGTLKEVVYPTGGKSAFTYQQHNYNKQLGADNKLGTVSGVSGGLRIHKIEEKDNDVVISQKEYDYQGSGIQSQLPEYYHKLVATTPSDQGKWTLFVSTYNPLNNPPVTYEKVKEIIPNQGHSIYTFQTFSPDGSFPYVNSAIGSFPSDELPFYGNWGGNQPYTVRSPRMFCPVSSRDFVRGVLLQKDVYSNDNKLLLTNKYEYKIIPNGGSETFAKALKMVYDTRWVGFPIAVNGEHPFYYKQYNYIYGQTKEETYAYDMNTGVSDNTKFVKSETLYSHNSIGQVIEVKTTNPDGKIIAERTKFPYDYPAAPESHPIGVMKIRNMLGVPVEQQTHRLDGTPRVLGGTINFFVDNILWGGLKRTEVYSMKTNSNLTATFSNFDASANFTYDDRYKNQLPTVKYNWYSTSGEPHIVTSSDGLITKTHYYGSSNTGEGSEAGAVSSKTNIDLFNPSNPTAHTDYQQTTTSYKYNPGVGLKEITDPRGRKTFYGYDALGRLASIKDHSANYLKTYSYNYRTSPIVAPVIGSFVDGELCPGEPSSGSEVSRVLIVGNSITKLIAQASPDGWRSDALIAEGGWGRASSTKDKDFVHILEKRFRDINPDVQVLPLWEAPFERDYPSGGIAGWLTFNYTDFQNRIISGFGGPGNKPDLIIIRLGENVNNSDVNPQNFKEAFKTLIDKILAVSTPGAKVIVTNSMWPDQPLANTKIQEVAAERNLPFVDLSDMSANEVYKAGKDPVSMAAFPNNTGDTHPGDAGMLEIADRIWSKVRNVDLASNIGGNVSKVRFYPRTDCCRDHIVGSVIQGSNDISNANGWTTLALINEVPSAGWNEYFIRTTTAWRYLRFLAGPNCSGELIELEFYNGNSKLTGATFGSAGYGVVFDGQMVNFWQGTAPGPQNYAGLDLGVGCSALTASMLSPANNASVVGTASTTTANRVTTAISVTTCVPTGITINSVEIWAATSDGGWPNRMGYAVADASQTGVYKLSSVEGSANGQWPTPYLGPGTYRFYAIVKTATSTVTTDYVTVTLTAPPVTGCPVLTASVLSPANNASVVGTASTTTANRVTTAISVTTCVPTGSTINSVEIWATTSDGGFPNRMGYAVADAGQPGVYKLSSVEGSANGQWPIPYLGPGTYRFYAIVKTATSTVTTDYITVTLTAPPVTGCPVLTASVLSPANNASVVGTASTTTANRVTTAISVTTCVPTGSTISSVEVWATTSDGGFPNRMGYAVADAGQPGVYKLSSVEGSANGQWPIPYLGPGTYRFYAIVKTATSTVTTDYITVTLTAPPVTGCPVLTASVLSPANNASVVGTASTTTADRVTTAISVMTCVPAGSTISSVEIWAATSDGGWPNRMGYAVADASQPGVYKLSSVEGSANGQWPTPYLGPGTYRFYAVVNTGTASFTTGYNTITLTAPAGTSCPALTGSVLSPANNASVVGTASTTTADRVTTAISVMTCVPAGSTISSVEIWAATSDGGWPNRMGYAIADASQPGVYKLSSVEGSANGQWPTPYLGPGTYRFYAVVNTGTASFTTGYNTITLTAPAGTSCPALTGSVLSPANNASVVGTASTTTANRVTTAISVTTCVPAGSIISSVEIWAATSDGGWPNRMGYAVADASQPGVYKLSSVEGSANGQWPTPYLGPGTYRFYAIVNTGTASFTTGYNTITLTAP